MLTKHGPMAVTGYATVYPRFPEQSSCPNRPTPQMTPEKNAGQNDEWDEAEVLEQRGTMRRTVLVELTSSLSIVTNTYHTRMIVPQYTKNSKTLYVCMCVCACGSAVCLCGSTYLVG